MVVVVMVVQHGFTCNWGQRTEEYGCGSCGPRDGNDHKGIPLNVTVATSPSFCPNGWLPPPESNKPQTPAPEANCPNGIPCFDNASSCSIGGTWLFDVVSDPSERANQVLLLLYQNLSLCLLEIYFRYHAFCAYFLMWIYCVCQASSNPAIVKQLMERLQSFNATNIPQESPGIDPRSSPSHFNNVW